jgi:hypothetical protein
MTEHLLISITVQILIRENRVSKSNENWSGSYFSVDDALMH